MYSTKLILVFVRIWIADKFQVAYSNNFSALEYSETQISIQAPYHLVLSSREVHKLVASILGAQRCGF